MNKVSEISAFVTPDSLYKVMPFGMKNCGMMFQRLMNCVIGGLDSVSSDWPEHIRHIRAFCERCSEAQLTINLLKSDFIKPLLCT